MNVFSPLFDADKREFLSDYSLAISVLTFTLIKLFAFHEVNGKLYQVFFDQSIINKHCLIRVRLKLHLIINSYIVEEFNFYHDTLITAPNMSKVTAATVFGAMGLGFPLSLLFFMDLNITSGIVNSSANK